MVRREAHGGVEWWNVTVNGAGMPTLEGEYGLADHYATIETVELIKQHAANNSRDIDIGWLVICGALVFFMQAGFAMLEVGIVQKKNATNILFKNMLDASIAGFFWWFLGYGFAFGPDHGGFIGKDHFALSGPSRSADGGAGLYSIWNGAGEGASDKWEFWFFQWAFNAAAATIVAGSVCERAKIEAYFIYSILITSFIYPVVVHWGWGYGFLSPWGAATGKLFLKSNPNTQSTGMIDFAGSGVVHMVGGFSGLMGAIICGPRRGRFVDGKVIDFTSGDKVLQSLGVFILWFGWYGFNCGSTLKLTAGMANVAGKVAVTTTLSACAGGIGATALSKIISGTYDISMGLNGVLAGLVSVTANCAVVNPWHAIIIGFVGSIILFFGSKLVQKLKIDDPCDACVVHGFCGFWGLLCAGIFCIDSNVQYAAYPGTPNDACKKGEQFGMQIVGGLCIIVWTVTMSGATFLCIKYTVGMQVSEEVEDLGLDVSEHGIEAPLARDSVHGMPIKDYVKNGDPLPDVTSSTVLAPPSGQYGASQSQYAALQSQYGAPQSFQMADYGQG